MMHTSIDLLKLFDSSARVRQDYAWLETERRPARADGGRRPLPGRHDPRRMKSTSRSDQIPDTLSFLERMEMVAWIQDTIDRELGPSGRDLVGPPMAAATFAPSVPGGRDVWAVARRTTTNAQLEASHKNLTKSGYLATDDSDGAELWRVSLRAAAFRDLDYGEFVESVRSVVEPVLAAQRLRQVVLGQLVAEHPGESFAGDSVCIWDPRERRGRPSRRSEQQKEVGDDQSAEDLRRILEAIPRQRPAQAASSPPTIWPSSTRPSGRSSSTHLRSSIASCSPDHSPTPKSKNCATPASTSPMPVTSAPARTALS